MLDIPFVPNPLVIEVRSIIEGEELRVYSCGLNYYDVALNLHGNPTSSAVFHRSDLKELIMQLKEILKKQPSQSYINKAGLYAVSKDDGLYAPINKNGKTVFLKICNTASKPEKYGFRKINKPGINFEKQNSFFTRIYKETFGVGNESN